MRDAGNWKSLLPILLLEAVRGVERLLPVRVFYWLLQPYACVRAWRHASPPARRWPACLGRRGERSGATLTPRAFHLNKVLELLPDRLAAPRWRKRCRIVGLDRLQAARRRGPVILAFFHFGPYFLAGLWLRAHGIAATGLMAGRRAERSPLRRYANRRLPFPEVPDLLHLDELREVVQICVDGGILIIAVDAFASRRVEVPIGGSGVFRMATGAMRLAARHGAALIPCNSIAEGPWRVRIELGRPVPGEYLAGKPDLLAAGQHLLAESLPHWQRHPGQCEALLECFQASASAG